MDPTGKDLVQHWSWAANKGLMNRNTAGALGAACHQVLSVIDGWEQIDVRELDIEDALRRFENLRAKDFKPQSLEVYKRRFRRAVASYLEYTRDPGGWKPSRRSTGSKPSRVTQKRQGESPTSAAVSTTAQEADRTGLVDYPFPLRTDLIAHLLLPADLRTAEVERLTSFMQLLATSTLQFEASNS